MATINTPAQIGDIVLLCHLKLSFQASFIFVEHTMRARAKSEDNIIVKSKLSEEVPFIDCGECLIYFISGD